MPATSCFLRPHDFHVSWIVLAGISNLLSIGGAVNGPPTEGSHTSPTSFLSFKTPWLCAASPWLWWHPGPLGACSLSMVSPSEPRVVLSPSVWLTPSLCLCPQSGYYLSPCQTSSPEPVLSRGPGQHHVRPSPAWPIAPPAGWPSQGHTGRQGASGSTCRGPVPTCVRSQFRFLPSRLRGTVLPDGSPSAPCRSVLDHHQSALPKSAFSEEAIDPRSLEEQAEESRQVSDGQGCVYTSGASCGHGYTWIYIFSCVFT